MASRALPSGSRVELPRSGRAIPLQPLSPCTALAFAVGALVGISILALLATSMIGPVGSKPFIVTLITGTLMTTLSVGGLIWQIARSCSGDSPRQAIQERESRSPIEAPESKNPEKKGGKPEKKGLKGGEGKPSARPQKRESKEERERLYNLRKPKPPALPKIAQPYLKSSATDWTHHTALTRRSSAKQFTTRGDVSIQPKNSRIGESAALCDSLEAELIDLLKQHTESPWSQEAVIRVADRLIHAAYALGVLTLEELPELVKQADDLDGLGMLDATPASILTHPSCYCSETFFACPKAYRLARQVAHWSSALGKIDIKKAPTRKERLLFHTKDTPQATWRELYNDYCTRVSRALSGEALPQQFAQWVRGDLSLDPQFAPF